MKSKTSALLAVLAFASLETQAGATISLGSAGSFGLLGGSGVTNAVAGTVVNNGNVGSAPTPAVTGFPPGVVNNGTLFTVADPVTAQAHADLQTAYTAAQTAPGGVVGPADLGGATLLRGSTPMLRPRLGRPGLSRWTAEIPTRSGSSRSAAPSRRPPVRRELEQWRVGGSCVLAARVLRDSRCNQHLRRKHSRASEHHPRRRHPERPGAGPRRSCHDWHCPDRKRPGTWHISASRLRAGESGCGRRSTRYVAGHGGLQRGLIRNSRDGNRRA